MLKPPTFGQPSNWMAFMTPSLPSCPAAQDFFARPRGVLVACALGEPETRVSDKRGRAGG